MKIRIIAVGKIKEDYLRDAISEYSKRISRFSDLDIIECVDEKTPDNASPVVVGQILDKEGERILSKIDDHDYVIALVIEGKMLSSTDLSEKLEDITLKGNSTIDFVIGGSLGLSDKVKQRSDFSLSFSNMTFPHQLMRVILLEQIYRSFKIINHEPYHK